LKTRKSTETTTAACGQRHISPEGSCEFDDDCDVEQAGGLAVPCPASNRPGASLCQASYSAVPEREKKRITLFSPNDIIPSFMKERILPISLS
jgi:hypothetical protein